jgi:hypothetical protein
MHLMMLNQRFFFLIIIFPPNIIRVQVNGCGISGLVTHNRRWFNFYIKAIALELLVGTRINLFAIVVKLENHVVCLLFPLEIVLLNLFMLFILICGDLLRLHHMMGIVIMLFLLMNAHNLHVFILLGVNLISFNAFLLFNQW